MVKDIHCNSKRLEAAEKSSGGGRGHKREGTFLHRIMTELLIQGDSRSRAVQVCGPCSGIISITPFQAQKYPGLDFMLCGHTPLGL